MSYSRISGTGGYLPEKVLSNNDLARMVDTSDEWIRERTGIRKRHIAGPDETTCDLAEHAARAAMDMAGRKPSDIDLIIVATTTPDRVFPSTACLLQQRLGIHGCAAFDVQAVCTGFIYALGVADRFVRTGGARCALVVGAETFSRIIDWTDRGTCVLFGDGAGAIVLEAQEGKGTIEDRGVLMSRLHSDGRYKDKLYVDGGPSSTRTVGHLRMEGREVFRHAVQNITAVMAETLLSADVAPDDIDWFIPHQANKRILDGTARKFNIPPDRVVMTVDRHGNTSAASVPLALDVAVKDGRVQEGDLILLEAMGGGFTWGATLLRW